MQRHQLDFRPWVVLFLILPWLTSCSNPPQTIEPSSTFTVSTATFIGSSPTPMIIPTLSAIETRTVIYEIINDNGGCRLPCIWGLTPGVTDTITRQNYLARFGTVSSDGFRSGRTNADSDEGAWGFNVQDDGLEINVSLNYRHNTNTIIDGLWLITLPLRDDIAAFGEPLYAELMQYYMLPQLLTRYGKPSDVLIGVWPHDPFLRSDYDPFSVVVIYEDIGIIAEYISPNETTGNSFRGCPSQAYLILRTWDPDNGFSLREIASLGATVGIREQTFDYFRPIEDSTSMTIDEFYLEFLRSDSTSCLETPQVLWLVP